MTDPTNARFGEPHAAREGYRLTRPEEDAQQRTETTGPAAPGSEHYGLRWDGSEFGDTRSGGTPTALPRRDTAPGHGESLTFPAEAYPPGGADSVFGPAPGGSATDIPTYTPEYLSGSTVQAPASTPTPGSGLPTRDSAASAATTPPPLPRREPAPHTMFASPFDSDYEHTQPESPEHLAAMDNESAPTSSFAATPAATPSSAPDSEAESQDPEDTVRRIAESLGIDTDLPHRTRGDRSDIGSRQPNSEHTGGHGPVESAPRPEQTDPDRDEAEPLRPADSGTRGSSPTQLPLRSPNRSHAAADADTEDRPAEPERGGDPSPANGGASSTALPNRRLPARAAKAAAAQARDDEPASDPAPAIAGAHEADTAPETPPAPTAQPSHRHSSEPEPSDAADETDPEPTANEPGDASQDTASFPVISDPLAAAATATPARPHASGRNGATVGLRSTPATALRAPADTDVLRRPDTESGAAESTSSSRPEPDTPDARVNVEATVAQPHSSAHAEATPTGESGSESRRTRRAAADHHAGETTEDIASRTGIAPTSRRASRRRAEATGDAPAIDVGVVMQLLLASHTLENVARNAEAGDVSLDDFITAAHRTRAAAVELVTTWFGGAAQMREFAEALLAATES
ncbi:hypothetical protein [Nocardia spumae]|uniref:hypothetical protein n=1 Tax=Nocardia spumae TaxID=2887190 RepID=UPI001D134FBC|nr:hypothetical protein [Nocardia spumae]